MLLNDFSPVKRRTLHKLRAQRSTENPLLPHPPIDINRRSRAYTSFEEYERAVVVEAREACRDTAQQIPTVLLNDDDSFRSRVLARGRSRDNVDARRTQ